MDDRTQNEVALGLRQGSPVAWRRLYDAYAPRVWRGVARLMGNRSSAVADVVQETFLAAARSARGFDADRGSLWAWLWGIARRQAAQHSREQARSEAVRRAAGWWSGLNGQRHDWVAGRADAPPEVLASREMAALVRATLAELPGDYQMLLTAKYMEGESVERLAGDLNSSGPAIRSKLARARRAFRRKFSKFTRATRGE